MGRRSEHTFEQIKQMAVEGAERIIKKKGLRELSTRKIAAEIGYTSGTLYLVFKNLDDLIVHVNARTLERLRDALASSTAGPAGEPAGEARDAVRAICRAYHRFANENPEFWSLVFEHPRPYRFERPAWYQALIAQCFAPLQSALRALCPGKNVGELSTAAQAIWAMVHGTHALYASGRAEAAGIAPAPDLNEFQVNTFLNGLTDKAS